MREQLSENGQAYIRVTGSSMQPLLHHLRDGVAIVPPREIRKGNIVLFDRKNGRYALHRVIQKGETGFTMAGDNQWFMEKDLPYDQIVGVASDIHRKGKWISCRSFRMRAYSRAVTLLAFPRIYLWKGIVWTGKLIRRVIGKKE